MVGDVAEKWTRFGMLRTLRWEPKVTQWPSGEDGGTYRLMCCGSVSGWAHVTWGCLRVHRVEAVCVWPCAVLYLGRDHHCRLPALSRQIDFQRV